MITPLGGWLIAIALLGGGGTVGAVAMWVNLDGSVTADGDGGGVFESPPASFAISGDLAEPVFPGGSAPLNLSISNPLDTDLTVSDLVVEVGAVEAPHATTELPCGVDDFAVEQLSGHHELVVGAGSRLSLDELGVPGDDWPRVLMRDTSNNQDGCKGASFSLTYSAVGRIVE